MLDQSTRYSIDNSLAFSLLTTAIWQIQLQQKDVWQVFEYTAYQRILRRLNLPNPHVAEKPIRRKKQSLS